MKLDNEFFTSKAAQAGPYFNVSWWQRVRIQWTAISSQHLERSSSTTPAETHEADTQWRWCGFVCWRDLQVQLIQTASWRVIAWSGAKLREAFLRTDRGFAQTEGFDWRHWRTWCSLCKLMDIISRSGLADACPNRFQTPLSGCTNHTKLLSLFRIQSLTRTLRTSWRTQDHQT